MNSDEVDLLCSYWTLAGPVEPNSGPEWSPLDFEERVKGAADAGFSGIGIWHADLFHLLRDRSLPELRGVLEANGIEHLELEFLNDWFLEAGDERREESDDLRETLFEAADVLGADRIKVGNIAGRRRPLRQITDAFEELCADALDLDTTIALEMTGGDVNIETLEEALSVVDGVRGGNGGLMLDIWHVAKMGISYDELRVLPNEFVAGVELNDGYLDCDLDYTEQTINHRKLPGEGEFDVPGFIDAVSETGFEGPWGVEILSKELRQLPVEEMCTRAYRATTNQFR